jgi:hypothetical protein
MSGPPSHEHSTVYLPAVTCQVLAWSSASQQVNTYLGNAGRGLAGVLGVDIQRSHKKQSEQGLGYFRMAVAAKWGALVPFLCVAGA